MNQAAKDPLWTVLVFLSTLMLGGVGCSQEVTCTTTAFGPVVRVMVLENYSTGASEWSEFSSKVHDTLWSFLNHRDTHSFGFTHSWY